MGMVYFALHKFRKNILENFGLLSSENTAFCFMFINFIGLLSSYGWTKLSDKTKKHKQIMILTSVMNGIIPCLFLLRELFYTPKDGIKWETMPKDYYSTLKEKDFKALFWTQLFPGTVFIIHSIFNVPLPPLLDDQTLKIIMSNGYRKEVYGRQRSFSTIAYLFVTMMGAFLCPTWNYKNGKNFLFPLFVFAMVYAFIIMIFVPNAEEQDSLIKEQEEKEKNKREQGTVDEKKEIVIEEEQQKKSLLRKTGFVFFLSAIFVGGIVRGVMSYYQATYLTAIAGYDSMATTFGDIYAIAAEIVLFVYGKIVLQIANVYWLMVFGQFVLMIRTFIYFCVPIKKVVNDKEINKEYLWAFYLAEAFKGISFGLIHLSGVTVAKDSASKGQEAEAQGLYTGVFANLAGGVSAVLFRFVSENNSNNKPNLKFKETAFLSVFSVLYITILYTIRGKILPKVKDFFCKT